MEYLEIWSEFDMTVLVDDDPINWNEEEAVMLKGAALWYVCECFDRSEDSLKMKRSQEVPL